MLCNGTVHCTLLTRLINMGSCVTSKMDCVYTELEEWDQVASRLGYVCAHLHTIGLTCVDVWCRVYICTCHHFHITLRYIIRHAFAYWHLHVGTLVMRLVGSHRLGWDNRIESNLFVKKLVNRIKLNVSRTNEWMALMSIHSLNAPCNERIRHGAS